MVPKPRTLIGMQAGKVVAVLRNFGEPNSKIKTDFKTRNSKLSQTKNSDLKKTKNSHENHSCVLYVKK